MVGGEGGHANTQLLDLKHEQGCKLDLVKKSETLCQLSNICWEWKPVLGEWKVEQVHSEVTKEYQNYQIHLFSIQAS